MYTYTQTNFGQSMILPDSSYVCIRCFFSTSLKYHFGIFILICPQEEVYAIDSYFGAKNHPEEHVSFIWHECRYIKTDLHKYI